MQELQREADTSPFVPDYLADSLRQIDFKALKARGVLYIAFDADSTLVTFWGRKLAPGSKKYLTQNRKLFKAWCIASNRLTNDLIPLGESIDAPVIRASLFTRKPQRRFFRQVIRHFGAQPHQIAMIGDKLYADIYGAKRMGLVTVWVKNYGHDSPWDMVLRTRFFQERIFRRYHKS